MIETLSSPIAQLGPQTRLVLEMRNGPEGFDNAQLKYAIEMATKQCRLVISMYGWPLRLSVRGELRQVYCEPPGDSPVARQARKDFAEARDFLVYRNDAFVRSYDGVECVFLDPLL